MGEYVLSAFYWLFFPALILFLFLYFESYMRNKRLVLHTKSDNDDDQDITVLPMSYPLFGHLVEIIRNKNRMIQWMAEVVNNSPSSTFLLRLPLRRHPLIITSNPAHVQHILKTRFEIYKKHRKFKVAFHDLFRDNLFLVDDQDWKILRQLASHEYNNRSFHKFVESVTEYELSNRLIPLLSNAASNNTIIDLHDIFRRFTFDIAFRMGLGHDLGYLSSPNNFPATNFADAFESAIEISMKRMLPFFTVIWKSKRFFNVGSERRLRREISEIREFLREIIITRSTTHDHHDFISGLMNSGKLDDAEFLIDASINFILGAQDTVLVALTWYFWSVLKNPDVEANIVKEVVIEKKDVRDMIYTHASICESMRLYPSVPLGGREATKDDILPDGTKVKKGTFVTYHTYAMGRSHELWGSDWAKFHPERWLKRERDDQWTFMPRDSFTYPVFHGGPRICLGKEIAFMHIKTVVAAVFRRFHIVPAMEEGHEPVYSSQSTSKMPNGFLVKVVDRNDMYIS